MGRSQSLIFDSYGSVLAVRIESGDRLRKSEKIVDIRQKIAEIPARIQRI